MSLGLAAQPTYYPYVNLILGAQSANDGEIAKFCEQSVMQKSDKISFRGPACDIGQSTLGMELNTHFPGSTSGLKSESDGAITIYFHQDKPEFKFVNPDGSYLTQGEVEFVTFAKDSNTRLKVIWYDGKTCISAPLK